MSLPRYTKYKESGFQWLGKVPEHWEVKPLYGTVVERVEPNKGMLENNLLSLSYGRIVKKDITSNDGLLPESFETYQIVRAGDIVFRLTDLQNDKRSLRSAFVEEDGIITSAYLAVTPRGVNSRYMNHLFRAYDVSKVFYSMGGGLRQSMKFADLKRMPTLIPPNDEQTAIADFLDHETAKIDALVAEQQRLIDLLAEKREAVISHAVTKGLNPNVRMKDSGVAWLGQVPEHWKVGPLKRMISRIESGTSVNAVDEPATPAALGVLKTSCVYSGQFRPEENKTVLDEEMDRVSCPLKPGSLIVSRMNTPDLVGSAGYVRTAPLNLFLPDRLWQISCLGSGARFLHYWTLTHAYRNHVRSFSTGTSPSMKNLTQDDFISFLVAAPSDDEQSDIANFLDHETAKVDTLVTEQRRLIDLLQERRSALITAAVTGQIDVRGLANN